MEKKITVIGAGNMGGALVEGLLKAEVNPSLINICDKSELIRDKFRAMGVDVYDDATMAVIGAQIVIIAVKPYLVKSVVDEISTLVEKAAVVSIAAGVSCDKLNEYFNYKKHCFRVIPNIAASFCSSMTFISCDREIKQQSYEIEALFLLVGEAVLIDEKLLDAAMVSASCGTAYALRYIRAAMEASIEMGLTAKMSRLVVAQTVKGASELLLNTEIHPEAAVDMVTTPGGITIKGLNQLEHKGFSSSVIDAHIAAYNYVKNK